MKKILFTAIAVFCLISNINIYAKDTSAYPPPLHVEGNRLKNGEGETVRLTGLSLPSMGWATGENDERNASFVMENWNVNFIRLTIRPMFWYGEEWYQNGNGSGYRNKIAELVEQVASKGKYIMLDLHEYEAVTERQVKWWEEIASIYGNHPAVIFGLLNEPHTTSWEIWRNGGFYGNPDNPSYTVGHQYLLEKIRATGAKNICVAGGLDWAYSYKGFLEGNYPLTEPAQNPGDGIMYDTHIYPLKGYKENWDDNVGMILDKFPVLVGEFGHFGVRFDWFDDSGHFVEPYIWNNQMMNWITRNELSYAGWCFHTSSTPAMLINNDFAVTPHSGLYQKENLLAQFPDTRPPLDERKYKELYPLDDWKEKINVTELKWETDDGVETVYGDGGVTFDFSRTGRVKAKIPGTVQTLGAAYVKFKIKSAVGEPTVRVGLELSDGRSFSVPFPITEYADSWFLPLKTFHGEEGILDTGLIESVFFESDENTSIFVDDFLLAGLDYIEPVPVSIIEDFDGEVTKWNSWQDFESENPDSMTTIHIKRGGINNSGFRRFYYTRPENSNGGEAFCTFPAGWSLKGVTYMKIWLKGDGTEQRLTLRLNDAFGSRKQMTKTYLREYEKWAIDINVTGNEWKQYVFRIDDLGMSDTIITETIKTLSVFNRTPGKSGSFSIDNLEFTNR
jgi:hypothetical protein